MTVTVSAISLLEVASGADVEAELRDAIEQAQLDDWRTQWQPELLRTLQELILRGVPRERWPQSWHWNWEAKTARVAGLLGFQGFSVVCAGVTQGLMRVDLTKTGQVAAQKGKPIVYIDFLEVAPWNRPDLGQPARYKGVGMALMVAAAALSEQEGFRGRIGLHSLPQSESFYRDHCGMIDLGPDAAYQNLRYFEMTPDQAKAFLE